MPTFSAKPGQNVRVYIRDKAFPVGNKEGDRLFFTGTVKEIVCNPEKVADKRFKNGFVVLKGRFMNKSFKKLEHRKIAFDDITRIVREAGDA